MPTVTPRVSGGVLGGASAVGVGEGGEVGGQPEAGHGPHLKVAIVPVMSASTCLLGPQPVGGTRSEQTV